MNSTRCLIVAAIVILAAVASHLAPEPPAGGYFSPITRDQAICLASGVAIGIGLTLLAIVIREWRSHRHYDRAIRAGRIMGGIRP